MAMRFDPREIDVHEFEPYDQDHFAWLRETLKLTEAEGVALEAGLLSAAKDWRYRSLGLGRLSAAETRMFTKLSKALATTIESLKDVELDSCRRLQSCHASYVGHQYCANLSFTNDDDWRSDVSLALEYDPFDPHRSSSYYLDELTTVLDKFFVRRRHRNRSMVGSSRTEKKCRPATMASQNGRDLGKGRWPSRLAPVSRGRGTPFGGGGPVPLHLPRSRPVDQGVRHRP